MTVVYVDLEHAAVLGDPVRGPAHRAKRERDRRRLETAAAQPCLVVRFPDVSPDRLRALRPSSVVLSGSTTDWNDYDAKELEGLLAVIREAATPMLGICAGHQLIGRAHNADWGPLGALQPTEADPDPRFATGQRKERGFLDVEIDVACVVFRGLQPTESFFQSHYWQLRDVPNGFLVRGRSSWSSIQAIERSDRPVFGLQFHPERYDALHPAGAVVLRNFFELTRGH